MNQIQIPGLNKKIIDSTKKSKIYLLGAFIFFVGSILIILFLLIIALIYVESINLLRIIIVFGTIFYLLLLTYGFREWIKFNYDLFLITSDEIIQIEQDGILNRRILRFLLEKISDVSVEIETFYQSLFNFGNIAIETKEEIFLFPMVPNPASFAHKIIKARNLKVKDTNLKPIDEKNILLSERKLTTEATGKIINEPHLKKKDEINLELHKKRRIILQPKDNDDNLTEEKTKSWWEIFWESLIGR